MKKLILLFSISCLVSFAYGQDSQSLKNDYNRGKELFQLKRYGLAMQVFKPLTGAANDNPYRLHAGFYYAVSAFYEGQYDLAAAMLNQVKKTDPDWEQMDEVNLWLSKIYAEKKAFGRAVETIEDIEDKEAKDYAYKNLQAELAKITSYDSLYNLYEQYPDDPEFAKNLAQAISKQPVASQNKTLLLELIRKFNLDVEKLDLLETTESIKKEAYNLAVLLPFMNKELAEDRNDIRNQFVIDIYQGVLLGQEELKTMGINLNIFSYDTEKDKQKTEQLLSLPELQHMDMIYGPLYPFPVLLTNRFSHTYAINMFNPLSANKQVIGNNPYSFLYMPTYETQGKKCAEYVLKNVPKKNGFIFYGTNEKDSVLAHSFAKTFYQAGDSALVLKKIKETNAKKIIEILTAGEEIELEPGDPSATTMFYDIPKDSLGFIFIASESIALASNAISAMETRADSTILIGMESWLNSQIISYDALERLRAILIAPTFIDYNSNAYQYFETIYKEKYHTLPGNNACIGYETVILLGKLLHQYGNHFENDFDTESIRGSLFQKYTLNRKNSNQYVPLIRFSDLELKLLNP